MTAKKPLELTSRPCKIDNVNLRVEKHGDDDMPAVDVRLSNIMLNKAEYIRLTGDAQAWNLLFEQERGGVVEPMQQYFEPARYLVAKWEECHSTIRFGMQKTEHEFENHRIKGAHVKGVVGGMVELTLTLQQSLEDTRIVAGLAEYQGKEAHVTITFGSISEVEKRQKKLPLNDEEADADDKPANRFGNNEQPAVQ
jgi:hypothetical protein